MSKQTEAPAKPSSQYSEEVVLSHGLGGLSALNFVNKLWSKDPSLWKDEPEHQKIILNSLGWLDLPQSMRKHADEVMAFANEMSGKFSHCVVLGMGGSSLAPEVIAKVFPRKKGWPALHVLDSTDPGWVLRLENEIDIKKTLFILSSKSGSTVEPNSFFKYFYDKTGENGEQFVAITDPGTSLEKMAAKLSFGKVFINPADVGGRFSALSLFGLVPAAIYGADIKELLARADAMAAACRNENLMENPGAKLGALMGDCANFNKNKLTLLCPQELNVFGLWMEQLVAESTGKEGKGIVPISGEAATDRYQEDRVFVEIEAKFLQMQNKNTAQDLKNKGYPTLSFTMNDAYDLGAQYILWEVATAAAGALLAINPFDQPNVQEAKTMAINALKELDSQKGAEAETEVKVTLSKQAKKLMGPRLVSLSSIKQSVMLMLNPGDYVSIMAYLDGSRKIDGILSDMRAEMLEMSGTPVMLGYGPRYLHSTGQLHKGGADNGVFVIFTAAPKQDAKIPGEKYSFAQLEYAQASGDFQALDSKGRRAIWVHLGSNPESRLEQN